MLSQISSRLAAEVDRSDDRLADPKTLSPDAMRRLRSATVYRLAAIAQRVVTEIRATERGGELDDLCDALEELNACANESVPWLRAARGERGAL